MRARALVTYRLTTSLVEMKIIAENMNIGGQLYRIFHALRRDFERLLHALEHTLTIVQRLIGFFELKKTKTKNGICGFCSSDIHANFAFASSPLHSKINEQRRTARAIGQAF